MLPGWGSSTAIGCEESGWGKEATPPHPITPSHPTSHPGVGAAMTGLRPIVEGMNMGFLLLAFNQISNNCGMLHYTSGGQFKVRAAPPRVGRAIREPSPPARPLPPKEAAPHGACLFAACLLACPRPACSPNRTGAPGHWRMLELRCLPKPLSGLHRGVEPGKV